MLKKLIIVILYLQTASSFAQYHPLIDENKTWVYKYYHHNSYFEDNVTYSFYFFKNDTTINNLVYTKLYSQQFYRKSIINFDYLNPSINNNLQNPIFEGLFREDTLKQQVFYKAKYYSTFGQYIFADEKLWFDFSVKKNDLVINGDIGQINGNPKVDSVSQIKLFNNETRKVIQYSSSLENKLIEEIGSIHGFLIPHEDLPLGTDGSAEGTDLICYSDTSLSLYGTCDQPAYVSSTNSAMFIANSLRVYPNPCKDILHIQNPLSTNNSIFISIYDTKGMLIKKANAQVQETTIDISDLPAGVYNIHVKNSSAILETQKFIKLID